MSDRLIQIWFCIFLLILEKQAIKAVVSSGLYFIMLCWRIGLKALLISLLCFHSVVDRALRVVKPNPLPAFIP